MKFKSNFLILANLQLYEIVRCNRKQPRRTSRGKSEIQREGARERGRRANIKERARREAEERRGPPEREVQDWLGTGGARRTFGGSLILFAYPGIGETFRSREGSTASYYRSALCFCVRNACTKKKRILRVTVLSYFEIFETSIIREIKRGDKVFLFAKRKKIKIDSSASTRGGTDENNQAAH